MYGFKSYHPIVNMIYFLFVLVFSCAILQPICLGISLACTVSYALVTGGRKNLKFLCLYALPVMFITAIVNPLFNHRGMTVLAYFSNGNPLTLESIVYGVVMAVMLCSVLCIFSAYNKIMTSDKFISIFGKIIPTFSLILSMVMRFVPVFSNKLTEIRHGQKCIGRDVTDGGVIQRAKNGLRILSVMITVSLEDSVETADSMRSRGYGLEGRTSYTDFVFDKRDFVALIVILVFGIYVIVGWIFGALEYRYQPTVRIGDITPYSISVMASCFLLYSIPLIIEIKEGIRWKLLKRKI